MEAIMIQPFWKWHTCYSADSVEWCPVDGYYDYFVCGTYQLKNDEDEGDSSKTVRLGRIYLFKSKGGENDPTLLQTIESAAILDQKWSRYPIGGDPMLACVTANGSLIIYKLQNNSLELVAEQQLGIKNALALSVDWSTNRQPTASPMLLVSDSRGFVTLYKLNEHLMQSGRWKAHDFEGWTVAFHSWSPDIFFSGGDDTLFKIFDTRIPDSPVKVNKAHQAGVTTFNSSIFKDNQLLSGSYDEHVRLWDLRSVKQPVIDKLVGGGIWRLKINPNNSDLILSACMYDGFKLLRLTEDDINIVHDYRQHDSIAYGADWKQDKADKLIIATCSFYDCQLHLSEVVRSEIKQE